MSREAHTIRVFWTPQGKQPGEGTHIGNCVRSEEGWWFNPFSAGRRRSRKFWPTWEACLPRWTGGLDATTSTPVYPPAKSWKAQVQADSSGRWYDNAIRMATEEEAKAYGFDLAMRWTGCDDVRAVESEDPVNYRWADGKLEAVK